MSMYQPEIKQCQNCKKDFTIDPEDFSFYEKIKVPAPTFCPECRMIRKMIWRNVRSLYKRSCGICNKTIIAMYSDDGAPVICSDCWNGTGWDSFSYGKDYDFSKPFFVQLKELFQTVPRFYAYRFGNLINSDYTNFAKDNRNCYLSYSVVVCEDVSYCEVIDKSKNSMDSYAVMKIDGCSYNIDCEGNYNTHFAVQTQNCVDSYFLYDCTNCQNCCLSSNLHNKQYYFKNQKLSKEEYQTALAELHLETFSGWQKTREDFDYMIHHDAIHRYAFIYAAEHAMGDYIHHAKNVKRCFDTNDAENVAYSMRAIEVKDCYDCQGVGFQAELIYESMAATQNTFNDAFCYLTIQGCRNCQYSFICKNCSDCFGCAGLTNAQFCIFNKQYSESDYHDLVVKIKQQMNDMPYIDSKGRVFKYGEFFPYDMCPFGYNETNAHDFFPLAKEEAIQKDFPWKDREKRDYAITKQSSELPDNIFDVTDDIYNETITCPNEGNSDFQCTTAFRIMPADLQFYRTKKLPLPRYCPNCRHYDRLKYRNPMKIYTRICSNTPCINTFQTTYQPERTEKIYCEICYQKEVL